MPKQFIKKITPDHDTIRNHKQLRLFSRFLMDPNLWHMNRRSIAGAMAAGLFWAMIPIPFQMIMAAITAILFRVNLPLSIALVWLTNPVTMPPVFYINYIVGTWVLGTPESVAPFEMSMDWFLNSMDQIWQPLYLGSLVNGIILATLGFVLLRIAWRMHIVSRYKKRKQKNKTV